MSRFLLDRFKKLPQNKLDVWEAAILPLPVWSAKSEGSPFRPHVGLVVSRHTGLVGSVEPHHPDDDSVGKLCEAILRFGYDKKLAGFRPGRIEVCDASLAEALGRRLMGSGVRCEPVEKLEAIDEMFAELCTIFTQKEETLYPPVMKEKGVTVEVVRSFAEAAAGFLEAGLWDELCDEDLIAIHKPRPPSGMKYVSVLGAGEYVQGLGFFKSVKQFQRVREVEDPVEFFEGSSVWSLQFGEALDLPPEEVDLWEAHGFPLVGPKAYPVLISYREGEPIRRPDAKRLRFVEGLLRALAESGPADFDAGRWERRVEVAGRAQAFVLEMKEVPAEFEAFPDPRLMERFTSRLGSMLSSEDLADEEEDDLPSTISFPMDIEALPKREAATPLEAAQERIYDALEARGWRRLQLARQALEICGDCADAYVLLAEDARNVTEARKLYAQGVAAGERALGAETFKESAGRFWGLIETRPYMRARAGLASCLWAEGAREEAVDHYRELIRLNPGDNQGIRYVLVGALLEMDLFEELESLLGKYADDGAATWAYVRALVTYKKEGNSKTARKQIQEAMKTNRHVPDYLLGQKDLPPETPAYYEPGQDSEAACCALEIMDGWQQDGRALEWLARVAGQKRR